MAEPLNLVPASSIVVQDGVVNGVVREIAARRGLTVKDFVLNHPGGSIGKTRK